MHFIVQYFKFPHSQPLTVDTSGFDFLHCFHKFLCICCICKYQQMRQRNDTYALKNSGLLKVVAQRNSLNVSKGFVCII